MMQKFKKVLVTCCCAALLLTSFSGVASAYTFYPEEYEGSYYLAEYKIPDMPDCKWESLSTVVSTKQTAKYFILTVKAGEHNEDLYISLPKEGGVRLQSLHEVQKENGITEPEINTVEELEPSGYEVIDYRKDGNNVILVGADGTSVKYVPTADGFTLQISNSTERIVNLTNGQISYGYGSSGDVVSIAVEMPLIEKEAIYGGGERFNDTNHVGHSFSLVNADSPSTDAYTYVNVPLFHSNRGYSLWFNMTGIGHADIGDTNKDKYTISFGQSDLDLYLWAGMPLENLKKYTDITGTSGLSETWTFGFWAGASSQSFNGTKKENAFLNLQDFLEGYKENYNFYPEAIYGEGTNSSTAKPMAYAKERGVRMLYWYQPALRISTLSEKLPSVSVYPTFDENGNMVESGLPYQWNTQFLQKFGVYRFVDANSTQKSWYDCSNPTMKNVINVTFSQLWEWGLSGAMIDYGEWLPWTGTHYNGMTAKEMHNLNSFYYAKVFNETWTKELKNDYVLFQRSGTAGTQYYVGNFLGDQYGTWEGMQDQINAMVTMGASGYNMYGGDLGSLLSKASSDLWNRWVVLSTFSPYMRQHGALWYPWEDFDALAAKTFGNYYYFRKNIVPTVESAAIDANKTSNPIVKGMMMAYPYQLPLADINNQYLFCDDFLVCAVTEENAWFEQVALPKGSTWYDLYSYKAYNGGQIMYAEAPTSTMPVFVKGGAVKAINLPESMTLGAEMHDDSGDEFAAIPSLLITPPDAERTTTIHVKDGASTDYRTYASHTEVYTNAPGNGATFTVTNTAGSPREIVVALGVTAAEIRVDGKVLTRLDHMPDYLNFEYGYYVDRQGLTTMLLPAGWKELTVVKGDSKYEPISLNGSSIISNMLNGKNETAYTLPIRDNSYTEVAMEKVNEIGRIVIKWAVGYSDVYDIEYSVDGENWALLLSDEADVNTVSGGTGSVDIIDFDAVEAKYLRLSSVKKGDVVQLPAIYSFEVYAPDTFEQIAEFIPDVEDIGDEEEDWSDEEWEDWEDDGEKDTEEDTNGASNRKKKIIVEVKSWWLLILLVSVGVLVVTGLILWFLLLRRKKKKQQAEQALEEAENAVTDFPDLPES